MDNTENLTVEDAAAGESDPGNSEKSSKKTYPTQAVLTIRMIVGVYVAYLAYQIITSKEEIPPLMWVPIVIFIIAGAALVITSVKHFVCGEYEGGKKDV